MAYLIRRKQPVAGAIRRILTEQNRKALALLEHWQQNPRERVHTGRQAFKRQRALLRLIRSGARYVYQVENRFYRDLGRSLAYVRDTEAIIEALTLVETGLTEPQSRESLQLLRAGLEQRAARELTDPVLDVPRRVREACDALREAARRLRRTPLPGVTRKKLRAAARKTLRRCEKSYAQVLATGSTADFHEWRRHVKCAYHQTRLMHDIMPDWCTNYGPPLERLGELLGHSQDLAVLDAVLREQPDELNLDSHLQHMRQVIGACQSSVQEQARQLGAQLFLQARVADSELAPVPAGEQVSEPTPARDQVAGLSPTEEPAAQDRPAADTVPPEMPRPEPAVPSPAGNVVDFVPRRGSGDETG